jgi:hypothetical protein
LEDDELPNSKEYLLYTEERVNDLHVMLSILKWDLKVCEDGTLSCIYLTHSVLDKDKMMDNVQKHNICTSHSYFFICRFVFYNQMNMGM